MNDPTFADMLQKFETLRQLYQKAPTKRLHNIAGLAALKVLAQSLIEIYANVRVTHRISLTILEAFLDGKIDQEKLRQWLTAFNDAERHLDDDLGKARSTLPEDWKSSRLRKMPIGFAIIEPGELTVSVFTDNPDSGTVVTIAGSKGVGPRDVMVTLSAQKTMSLTRALVGCSALMQKEIDEGRGGTDFEIPVDPEELHYPLDVIDPLPVVEHKGEMKKPLPQYLDKVWGTGPTPRMPWEKE